LIRGSRRSNDEPDSRSNSAGTIPRESMNAIRLPTICVLLSLGACAPSTEDRITQAMPLSSAVLEAQHALEADPGDGKAFAAEFAGRVRMRAIECSRGQSFDWWATEEALRKALAPDKDCFAAADQALLEWLHWRRIGQVLAQPPLRPLPATPATIGPANAQDAAIRHVDFAEHAGVAAVVLAQAVVLFDTNDGRPIATSTVAGAGPVAVSPNGRITAVGLRDTLQLRGSDGGDFGIIGDVARGRGWWLSDTVLAFDDARDDSLRIIDFGHARESRLPGLTGVHDVVTQPDAPGRVLALAKQGAVLLVVAPAGSPYRPDASVAPLPGMSLVEGDRAITPEGRVFGLAQGGVLQATRDAGDTAHLRFDGDLRRLEFGDLPLQGVQPSGDPDQLLLALPGKYGALWYAWSLSRRELAPLEPQPAADARVEYVPALRRNVIIDADGVRVADRLHTGAPEPLDALARRFGTALAASTLAQVEPAPAAPVAKPASPPPEPASGPRAVVNGREVPIVPVEGGGPFAQINGRVVPVPNASPASPRAPPPPGPPLKGKAALVDGLRRGVLRLATEADFNAWKRSYEQQARHGVPREFNEHVSFGQTMYVITGDYTIPDDLTGSASAVFIIERGAPFPNGEASHSTLLDVSSGACVGWTCRSLSGED
jgi:hypothetical protein